MNLSKNLDPKSRSVSLLSIIRENLVEFKSNPHTIKNLPTHKTTCLLCNMPQSLPRFKVYKRHSNKKLRNFAKIQTLNFSRAYSKEVSKPAWWRLFHIQKKSSKSAWTIMGKVIVKVNSRKNYIKWMIWKFLKKF